MAEHSERRRDHCNRPIAADSHILEQFVSEYLCVLKNLARLLDELPPDACSGDPLVADEVVEAGCGEDWRQAVFCHDPQVCEGT